MTVHERTPSTDVTRRVMLRSATVGGVALPFLAACGGSDDGTGAGGASKSPSAGAAGSGGSATVAVSDVPEGGGTILADQRVVVVQPTKGDFKAYTAICTHQKCTVTKVENGQIICPCHGSHYSIKDGSVLSGPAPSPLAAKKVSVEGNKISVG